MESSRIFLAAQRGELTEEHLHAYVSGVLLQIRGVLPLIRRAEERARAIGDLPLAEHYAHKFREEGGHDLWAEEDLRRLSPSTPAPAGAGSPALTQLLKYLEEVVDRDPGLYLAYILLAEYLTVLVGPKWLEALETQCGVPQSKLSVLGNHIVLDREHVAEGVREIDALVTSADKREPMRQVLRTGMAYYERFWNEILAMTIKAA